MLVFMCTVGPIYYGPPARVRGLVDGKTSGHSEPLPGQEEKKRGWARARMCLTVAGFVALAPPPPPHALFIDFSSSAAHPRLQPGFYHGHAKADHARGRG